MLITYYNLTMCFFWTVTKKTSYLGQSMVKKQYLTKKLMKMNETK